ncbi:MAG: YidC/Oxa1 family membrane protein insertase [bacterium]
MFHTIFYLPLYNALIAITGLFGGSLGFGVVGLTLLVKLILSPLSYQSTISQIEQKKLLPYISDIKKKYPDQKEQAAKLNELYKEHKTHPLSGCLLLLLQLPVLFAIFYVFKSGSVVNPADLYSFVNLPGAINPVFFGINITQPNIILLIITALAQYFQVAWSPSMQASSEPVDPTDTQAALAANMQKMMKYMIPVMIVIGGWGLPGAVALYWVLSSIFMIIQERIIMKVIERKDKKSA